MRRASGVPSTDGFIRGGEALVVPPNTRATLLLDYARTTNAYTIVETSGGAGSTLTLTYAEAAIDSAGNKGNRNDVDGRRIRGIRDVIRPGGGERRRFQTLYWRSGRYVELDVQTAAEPLRIHDVSGIFTAYPFVERGRFTSDLPWLADMWRMNWNGARIGAFETYMDTPYYEQLQYVGDTRLQALISLYVSGDDRLVRQAIVHFDDSRIPEGITASRYPSELQQLIPPFALIYVAMVHDYQLHRDDPAFVRTRLAGVRGILDWYGRRVDSTGMLGPMPYWNFVDWAERWTARRPRRRGRRPLGDREPALRVRARPRRAARGRARCAGDGAIVPRAGRRIAARRARARVGRAARPVPRSRPTRRRSASRRTCSRSSPMRCPPPSSARSWSASSPIRRSSPRRTTSRGTCTRRCARSGLADRYIAQLAPWRTMLALGLTSAPEKPEPTRSDSHAWAAHPNYGLLATVLGVRPASSGFRTVSIAPALGPLQRAAGRVPHPRGDIDVALTRVGSSGLSAEVTLPAGVSGRFEWQGRSVPLRAGAQTVRF